MLKNWLNESHRPHPHVWVRGTYLTVTDGKVILSGDSGLFGGFEQEDLRFLQEFLQRSLEDPNC